MDEYLLRQWRKAAREIADRAFLMANEANYRRAFAQLVQIRTILAALDRQSARYVADLIDSVYRDADKHAVRLLVQQGKEGVYSSFSRVNERAVDYLAQGVQGRLSSALDGVGKRADEFFRRTRLSAQLDRTIQAKVIRGTIQGLARGKLARRVAEDLRREFADGAVSIIGRDGRTYQFGADYYANMVVQNGRRQAMTAATINRTAENGEDLVIVSTNFSIIGDFCDAYRGRIYSLSGTSANIPALAAIPNGGPPLHPNCRHSIQPYVRDFHDEAETAARANTDPRFLNVDARTASRRWKALGGIAQAQLRHAPDQWTAVQVA